MSIGKTYLDIITSEPIINISTRDIGDQKHVKIKGLDADEVTVVMSGEALTFGPVSYSNTSVGYPYQFPSTSTNFIMCSNDSSVICPVSGILTSISFALTTSYSYRGDYNGNLIIVTGKIIDNTYTETDSINISSISIPSQSVYTNSTLI
jgi:hypothetical protein